MPRNYGKRTRVYVQMGRDASDPLWLKYCFATGLTKESDMTELGQVKLNTLSMDAASIMNLALGVNSPKPNRATKLHPDMSLAFESSFVADAKISSAKQAGWIISPPKPMRSRRSSPRSRALYILINGIKYAWQSPYSPQASDPDLSVLGIKVPSAGEEGLVWGASFPKPPVMGLVIKAATNEDPTEDVYSTFCDPTKVDAAKQAGWFEMRRKGTGRYTPTDAVRFLK